MNENEPLEFAESSKKVAQKIDEEIDGIRTKIKKDFPPRDITHITDFALLEKLKKDQGKLGWIMLILTHERNVNIPEKKNI